MSEQEFVPMPLRNPVPDKPADERDFDGWERSLHGRMQDYASRDEAIETVAYEPDER